MHVIRRRGWEIPEGLATPEHLFVNRRGLLAASAAAALSLAPKLAFAQRISDLPDPTKDLYPVGRNEKYALDRPITDEKINTSYNLPAVYNARFFAAAGGLLSSGPDLLDQSRSAARYVDRILKGEEPANLPVQAPTKYELVINLK